MWTPDICIYHDPCDDGFGSAWAVWRKWGEAVDFRPTNYGLPVPDEAIDGQHVLISDFSFKPDVLEALAARAASIVILDHHKTAESDLIAYRVASAVTAAGLAPVDEWIAAYRFEDSHPARRSDFGMLHVAPNVLAMFDMNRSGAMLTWRFCFPGEKPPQLVRHLQDRDLWHMALPDTRRLSLYLRSFERDFEKWTVISETLEGRAFSRHDMFVEMEAIERAYDRQLADMVPAARLEKIGRWHDVPVAHAPYAFASDLAHELLLAHPDAPFAAVCVHAHGARSYSLRSQDSRQDVSEVARQFGGGGHRNAAGFRCPA